MVEDNIHQGDIQIRFGDVFVLHIILIIEVVTVFLIVI